MFTRTRRRLWAAGCLTVAVATTLSGCSLSGGNASKTSKTTLGRASSTSGASTFRTVPVSPTSTLATTIPPVPQTDKTGSTLAPDGTWTVQANDTLSGIATKLGVSYTDLLAANPEIDPKKFLIIGQKLNVPTQSSVSAPSVNTPTQTQPPGQSTPTTTSGVQASGQTYTVVAGDYFIGIAKKLGVSLDSLLSVNNMSASSLITAGMKLKVPKGGTVPKATATTTAAKTTTTTVKK